MHDSRGRQLRADQQGANCICVRVLNLGYAYVFALNLKLQTVETNRVRAVFQNLYMNKLSLNSRNKSS
jgi:hypothetical protein